MAKALDKNGSDGEWMKAGVAKRIRYPCSPSRKRCPLGVASSKRACSVGAKALNGPPGEYARKSET